MIKVTDAAIKQILWMMKEGEKEGEYVRFKVHGGGCSGLSYGLGFESEKQESDTVVSFDDVSFLVDTESAPIVRDTVIDFKESLLGGGFIIENPNAIATCGCGSSFRTKENLGTPEEC